MASKKGYDVLRLVEHGATCYISSEYVEGKVLAGWLRYHPNVTKKQLFSWIQSMIKQLGMLHKCRRNPYYQYVNPYSIIITENGELYFLDMDAKSNEEQLRLMRRRVIRETFLPPEKPYYQNPSIGLDIYGLGKTIQYLLSVSELDPPLSKQEEKKFQRIISKCLKRQSKSSYQNVSEIRKHIPIYKEKIKKQNSGIKKILVLFVVLILFAILCIGMTWKIKEEQGKSGNNFQMNGEIQENAVENDEEKLELAIAYFLDIQDYEKSLYYLEKMSSSSIISEDLQVIVRAFLGEEGKRETELLEKHLKDLEERIPKQDSSRYYHCLVKGYGLLDTQNAAGEVLRLGKVYLDLEENDNKEKREVQEYMASAYEKIGEEEEAAHAYEELLGMETDEREREEIYKQIVMLYETCEKNDMALDTCVQGIGECKESKELKIMHIRLLCKDTSIDRNLCAQTIREYIGQTPEILEAEEFQKLQREYEIRVEGEEVWVGK